MQLSDEAVNRLRSNARSVVRELGLLNDAYFDIGVTLAERHFLIELSSCVYPTVGEIAERLLLDKSTASRLISKAVKKGYVRLSSDKSDKRKRFLELTEKGREVLNAFEPIAFHQTKEALLSLTDEEIDMVYRGIALYAKGLHQSRLRKKVDMGAMTSQDYAFAHLLIEKDDGVEWAHFVERYQQKGFGYFVLKMDSKMIGGAGISPYDFREAGCALEKIRLQPEMCKAGFEKLLIDFAMTEAKKMGYVHCYVDLTKERAFSCEFFQQQGFQETDQDNAALLWKAC